MIDGRGRARITDFGLAVAAGADAGGSEVSGTPAYMAPEQLAGKGSSVQSDLYALGLVLYELFTGRKAFEAATLAEWRRVHSQEPPTSPSAVAREIEPAVERVILRCLEKEPGRRPRSAAAVAAALPGGDPLAAAIAAGETPSPEMVAAAGETGALRPSVAMGFLAATLAGIALVAFLSPRAYLHGHVPLEKPPDALVERSREIVRRLGDQDKPADTAWGIEVNLIYRRWVEKHDNGNDRWKDLPEGRPAAIYFWYRQSSARLIPERYRGDDFGWWTLSETDPPVNRSGMIGVQLDGLGRLIRFEAVPSSSPQPAAGKAAPEWPALFSEAGLDIAAFAKTEPQWVPPFFADTREAWVETRPRRSDRPMRVEAAALAGRPVYFELAWPWTRPPGTLPHEPIGAQAVTESFGVGVLLLLIVAGSLIARRNLRLGRGDRRGATRLAAFLFSCVLIGWALHARHVAGVSELPLFLSGAGFALFSAALAWILYVALEPILRRRWPDSLIAWTRLLSGRLNDPLVGRVLLAGALLGTFEAVIWAVAHIESQAIESPPPFPLFAFPQTLLGPRLVASHLFAAIGVSLFIAVANAFLFTLFRAVLKKDWLAAAAFVLFWAIFNFLAGGPIAVAAGVVVTAAYISFFLRFGLLVLFVEDYFAHFLQFALTTDSSAWYAGTSLFLLIVLAAITVFGFRTATAGQPLFSGARLDD
jgi:eukaryotic-like serine/threonine-protein kinase